MTFSGGNLEKATQAQIKAIPLIKALFSEVNPIPVKAGLNMIGYNCGVPRLPLVEMTQENQAILKCEIEQMKKA